MIIFSRSDRDRRSQFAEKIAGRSAIKRSAIAIVDNFFEIGSRSAIEISKKDRRTISDREINNRDRKKRDLIDIIQQIADALEKVCN